MLPLLSHPEESGIKEKKLVDHLYNVANAIEKKIASKQLNLNLINMEKLKRLGRIIGLIHDLGKGTVFFQKYIRGLSGQHSLTHHSLFSAVACFWIVENEFSGGDDGELWAYTGFQVVYRHHGNLVAFDMQNSNRKCNLGPCDDQLQNMSDNYWEELADFYKNENIDLSILKQRSFRKFKCFLADDAHYLVEDTISLDEDKVEFFFLVNFLFSTLVDSDKADAARLSNSYFQGNLEERLLDVYGYIEKCRHDNPEKFNPDKPINELRNRFLKEIESNPNISKKNKFYSITAPTGIGKTFGCMAFAERLKAMFPEKRGRIIYCLPYTSIIDQNYDEFEKVIQHSNPRYNERPTRYLLKHHHLTQKKVTNRIDEKYTYKDYMDDRLLVESWQSAMVVTTFVQVFHTIIGYTNRFLKKFHNVINSIVILDEVQNIDPDFHKLIKTAFKVLGERFNTYFVLVTATQPKILDSLKMVPVVDEDRYMTADLFNRVRLSIKLSPTTPEIFCSDFTTTFKDDNCLIVVNTIKCAQQIYRLLNKKHSEKDVKYYCLTTRLTPKDRKKYISEIKHRLGNGQETIVVSTQLIEAGVDLSFKTVYRDLGPVDSIIQVAGRCNRNGEYGFLGGNMTLINMENYGIYKPSLMQYVRDAIRKSEYESKDFNKLSKLYFERFNFTRVANEIMAAISELNYDQKTDGQTPVSDFELIKDSLFNKRIFILQTVQAQDQMIKLLAQLKKIKIGDLNKKEKEDCMIKVEKSKHYLNQYAISVPKQILEKYVPIIEPHTTDIKKNDFFYNYISFEKLNYAYEKNLGFSPEPLKSLPVSLNV